MDASRDARPAEGTRSEIALRVVIVYNASTGTALSLSKVMPYAWVGVFAAWTVAYGRQQRKKGERMTAAAAQA